MVREDLVHRCSTVLQGHGGAIGSLASSSVVRGGVMRIRSVVFSLLILSELPAKGQCGWEALGSGLGDPIQVNAIAILSSGDIVAGGQFVTAGGVTANNIARWNGSAWFPLGSGMSSADGNTSAVYSLAALSNGDLVAGGLFTNAGGVTVNNIARWNGNTWSEFGEGLRATAVVAMAVLPNGELVAGGERINQGGGTINNIAHWNGNRWSALGAGMNGYVRALKVLPDGSLVAGGTFTTVGGTTVNRIARWNGINWSEMGQGMNSTVLALEVLPNGDLVAAGDFTSTGQFPVNAIARWDGSNWSAMGSGIRDSTVIALTAFPDGDLVVGGTFTSAGSLAANRIARWNGCNWSSFGSGMNYTVFSLAALSNGDIVAAGNFSMAGGVSASGVAIARMLQLGRVSQHPANVALIPGSTANLQISVEGTGPFTFQWRRNGVDVVNSSRVSGANTTTLTISNATATDQGEYECHIANSCGSFISRSATLSCAPIINQQPVAFQRLASGMQLVLQVPAGASYSYRWRQNGQNLFNIPGLFGGVTSRTLTIQGQDSSLAGVYDCVLTNSCGTVISNASHVPCLADFNLDGAVDSDDVITYFAQWDSSDANADVNRDGGVDGDDIVVFFGRWDGGC